MLDLYQIYFEPVSIPASFTVSLVIQLKTLLHNKGTDLTYSQFCIKYST